MLTPVTSSPPKHIPVHHQKKYQSMKMMPQQYCLRWKHHHTNVQNMFAQLLEKERFCDVTLYCSPNFATQVPNKDTVDPQHIRGVSLRAHRVVLAACSELLGALLSAHETHGEPVLVIDGAEPRHLKALLDYMYTGEMNVHHSQLASLLKTAEELRIKGLTDIRWNNKDEPPDCTGGLVAAVATDDNKTDKSNSVDRPVEKPVDQLASPKLGSPKHGSPKTVSPKITSPRHVSPKTDLKDMTMSELKAYVKKEDSEAEAKDKFSVNGGPPPLIKLPTKEKHTPPKRDHSDSESPSPKRQRHASGTEHTDEESMSHKSDNQEWQHGNLDITAERVVGWGMGEAESTCQWSRSASDDEWADAPTDIGSFLHTRLRVDGDNSADEESNDSTIAAVHSAPASSSSSMTEMKADIAPPSTLPACMNACSNTNFINKPTLGPKSGPTDPRFTDVVKLSDYLQHGRRPQFWEEHYVKRVMEAVRVKELEMKQAAEILGVSYGTLYGRYRDVYGCINRPYRRENPICFDRTARDFWQAKGPSEVLERLQRGDISIDAAALALGVSVANLSAYVADFPQEKDFEPIPIEIDPSLKMRPRTYSGGAVPAPPVTCTSKSVAKRPDKPPTKKVMIGSLNDEDPIPATVITTHDKTFATTTAPSGKWPTIRVASLDSLRASDPPSASASALMRTRPDLTIVAKKTDTKRDDEEDT